MVRGAMGPELERALKEQLAAERAVREGKAERKVVRVITIARQLYSRCLGGLVHVDICSVYNTELLLL